MGPRGICHTIRALIETQVVRPYIGDHTDDIFDILILVQMEQERASTLTAMRNMKVTGPKRIDI